MLIYPPTGKGRITITFQDANRLKPGAQLNDTVVEFGLTHALSSHTCSNNPTLAAQVHIFSPLFFKKLTEGG
ncbi:hypothetical protein K438DRAFT_1631210 [Mycena galopus ATCC 62051]|nr:hypothetical protein K438DRAFT_1631210 [Mycena galopus ATCC 62051]